ncbi:MULTISPECIES: translational GTPase TypA [Candidatus Ichthyocystis]|uniref:Large ribosomal subunit assembly factor BipA n=1 Tax=Candidatus Ichthyocystis hellenicum TaxID=1561003 RepID=A0A0S4M5W6_9BURK|nr:MULTISPECIES: translational GTPase TypA [Ichthyocystis]CUT17645.1 putative Elongation factor Tu GTP binding protein [Candidatus Ichthyocystis hellenicum]
MQRPVRNIAIIAHVDHGKTTLVDKLLQQSGTFEAHQQIAERVMDSNDLERERGITILAKNTAVDYKGIHINIIDTPGHADFGGEVERVLSMVDGALLVVDAVDGPMPQTRFVTKKALMLGLKPIVVVNKVDRDYANPDRAVDQVFDLFDRLGATEDQLDFSVIYASALYGWSVVDIGDDRESMIPLFDAIIDQVSPPIADIDAPLQLQISALDYSSYVGRIGIGRIHRGSLRTGDRVVVCNRDGERFKTTISAIYGFRGLDRVQLEEAFAGDIVQIEGVEVLTIGATICSQEVVDPLPILSVDEPTLRISFLVNSSPFAGKEGKFLTSRQIRERLQRECLTNVALQVHETPNSDVFEVCGRGELHLSILLENMRREGYEMAVGRPQVIRKEVDSVWHEPFERLTLEIDSKSQGAVIQALGLRGGELVELIVVEDDRLRLEYRMPARGLIGFQSEFLNLTRGTGVMSHVFDDYAPSVSNEIVSRTQGVIISQEQGVAVAYSLWKLQERGRLFIDPGEPVYEGMIIGIHSRENDLVVNPIREKKLTNTRADGKDDHIDLVPPIELSLEAAIAFIAEDELVEVTPKKIRLRKRHLSESDRRRYARSVGP